MDLRVKDDEGGASDCKRRLAWTAMRTQHNFQSSLSVHLFRLSDIDSDGFTVTNSQLALTTVNWNHGIGRRDTEHKERHGKIPGALRKAQHIRDSSCNPFEYFRERRLELEAFHRCRTITLSYPRLWSCRREVNMGQYSPPH